MRYLLLITVLFVSCQQEPYYSEERELNPEAWSTDDALMFDLTVNDTTSIFNMELHLKHTTEYAYENIYLLVTTNFPDREPAEERLNIQLAEKTGKWIGNCRSEDCSLKVYLLDQFRFPSTGDYSFQIKQHTRDKNLKGISAMKFIINKNEE